MNWNLKKQSPLGTREMGFAQLQTIKQENQIKSQRNQLRNIQYRQLEFLMREVWVMCSPGSIRNDNELYLMDHLLFCNCNCNYDCAYDSNYDYIPEKQCEL